MNKLLLTCFLALLCLVGRYYTASSKVADSPPEEPLHRSALLVSPHSGDTHRGGAILSDTFPRIDFGLVNKHLDSGAGEETVSFQPAPVTVSASSLSQISNSPNQLSLELSGGEASVTSLPSSVSRLLSSRNKTASLRASPPATAGRRCDDNLHRSSDIGHPTKGTSLVDDSTSQGQEEGNTPAQVGEGIALIYGELINPDSLGPLTVTFSPYYLNKKTAFEEQVLEVPLQEGTMFDGVVNPWSSKFLLQSPLLKRPAYFTLKLDDRVILGDFLIFPGDSLKVYVDLKESHIVFSGPDALTAEVQYGMKRMKVRSEFSEPRKIIMANPNQVFSDNDLKKMEEQKQAFGARLEMENPNEESLDKLLTQISNNDPETALKEAGLDPLIQKLDPVRKDLILLDFFSGFYRSPVSTLYLFYYPSIPYLLEKDVLDSTYVEIRRILESIPTAAFPESAKLVSGNWLELELDRLSLLSVITKEPFLITLERNHQGEVAERLGTAFLDQNLRRYPDPAAVLKDYAGFIQTDPWVKKLTSLKSATVPGDKLIGVWVQNLSGDTLQLESILDKPTLVYFYFSTCTHSANYFKDLLYPFYRQKASELGVDLIAVSVDRDPALWRKNIEEYSDSSIANYLFLPDSKEDWVSHYNISGYPRTFILDPNGKILSFGLSRESGKAFEDDFEKIFPTNNTSYKSDQP